MFGTLCSLSQDTEAQEHQDFPLGLEAVKVPEDMNITKYYLELRSRLVNPGRDMSVSRGC